MGGFIDVAGMANLLQRVEPHRFGSTLGHYGVVRPYMQLPFYGSFTPV